MGRLSVDDLIIAAHPDDEVIGAGIWMHRHRGSRVHILHITDGSPRDMCDARRLGFATREAYANARRHELREALELVGIPDDRCISLAFPDKEAYLQLPALVSQMAALVHELRPRMILSPAYEGGHPDHDAAAFAAAQVQARESCPEHREYPLYHAGPGGEMETGAFLSCEPPAQAVPQEVITFSPTECTLKRRMLAHFRTQQQILSCFRVDREPFRQAPAYDFTRPPHPGPLLYEIWDWGISGQEWRQEARRCLAA